MTIQIPGFATDQQYPFWFLRKMMSAFGTAGVVNPSTDYIVSPSSGLQVQVTSGAAFVQQTVNIEGTSAYNGLYFEVNDATTNPVNTITAPVSNPRIDQIILRVYDVQEQGLGGSSKGQIEWLPGTESASASLSTMGPGLSNPGAAALPANSLQLAYVLQTVAESSIASANILDVRPRTHGATNIATTESRTNTAYGTMPTPDQVTGIVLPTNGKLRVSYQAIWQNSVGGAGQAAIFLNSNQMVIQGWDAVTGHQPLPESASNAPTGLNTPLFSFFGGLASGTSSTAFTADVTTGQAIGFLNIGGGNIGIQVGASPAQVSYTSSGGAGASAGAAGGVCEIFAAAGTYTVSVQFKSSSGSVTASNRKLWVEAVSFG